MMQSLDRRAAIRSRYPGLPPLIVTSVVSARIVHPTDRSTLRMNAKNAKPAKICLRRMFMLELEIGELAAVFDAEQDDGYEQRRPGGPANDQGPSRQPFAQTDVGPPLTDLHRQQGQHSESSD